MAETAATWQVGERSVRVSRLDAAWWPEDGITKGDLLAYDLAIAPVMLPHLAGRPLTLRVYPDGIDGPSHYRRAVPTGAPRWLGHVDYLPAEAATPTPLPLADEAADLVWLANRGCVEFHAWNSRVPALDEPDQAVFDLDPGEVATFPDVLRAALLLREDLERFGLATCPKTSGRRGLHVHVPLAPGASFAAVREWVKGVAERLAARDPDRIAVAHGATHRGDRVTVDYAQNSVARTMAAPYGVRAAPGAPVSAPLSWEEVAAGKVRPEDFTLRTMPARVAQVGDLFAPVLQHTQRLPG